MPFEIHISSRECNRRVSFALPEVKLNQGRKNKPPDVDGHKS